MNSTRSHQCEPMSANARDGPPSCGVDAPVVVLRGRAASPAGSRRGSGAPARARRRRSGRAPRARPGGSGRRTGRSPIRPARGGRRDERGRPGRRRSPAASRRRRACRARARAPRAPRGGCWACRCAATSISSAVASSSGGRIGALGPEPLGGGARALGRRRGDARYARAGQSRRAGVDRADEAGADDTGAQGDGRLRCSRRARRRASSPPSPRTVCSLLRSVKQKTAAVR